MDTENGIRKVSEDSTSYLDYQVQQWLHSLPADLQLNTTLENEVAFGGETKVMLKVLLHFRASQLRIILRRPDLLSRERIAQNMEAVEVVVDLARDMVQRIHALHQNTSIYKKHRTAFDSFLISAVAVFCLVTCYAPENFYSRVQHDFLIALEVVKGLLTTSISARRLWKTIRQIRRVSPHLESISETSSHIAEATTGSATPLEAANHLTGTEESSSHLPTEEEVVRTAPSTRFDALDVWPENVFQVSQELDELFETFNQQQANSASYEDGALRDHSESGPSSSGNLSTIFSSPENDADVFKLFTELF